MRRFAPPFINVLLLLTIIGLGWQHFSPVTTSSKEQAHAQTINSIQHIVFIVKENHPFDQMFGLFPGANGTGGVGFIKKNGVTTQISLNTAPPHRRTMPSTRTPSLPANGTTPCRRRTPPLLSS